MKTTKILTILALALVLLVCLAKVAGAAPMGTAIMYQGRLVDNNSPADGLYDFQFRLYDANSGGNKVGSDVNEHNVDVIDGYFTVELDFGGGVFDGDARWLGIGVRPGDLNDPNTYTILSPRVELAPTPYALYAKTAGSASGGGWVDDGAVVRLDSSGDSVGIGTSGPGVKLHVYEPSSSDVYMSVEASSSSGEAGIRLRNPAGGWDVFANNDDGDLGIAHALSDRVLTIKKTTGYVGIGTSSPSAKLTVDGAILREGSTMYGSFGYTHINLGRLSTTGTSGQSYPDCTVGGGYLNTASISYATVGGGPQQ